MTTAQLFDNMQHRLVDLNTNLPTDEVDALKTYTIYQKEVSKIYKKLNSILESHSSEVEDLARIVNLNLDRAS